MKKNKSKNNAASAAPAPAPAPKASSSKKSKPAVFRHISEFLQKNAKGFVKSSRIMKNKKLAEESLKMMMLIRRFEQQAAALYGAGQIGGFCHLYTGQEAVIAGLKASLDKDDDIVTSYRDHGAILACGSDPNAVMAELTGRVGGISKGKGGSMHMFDVKNHFYGGHGIVGAQVPIGTGIGLTARLKNSKKKNISVTMLGDGASNQGQVYESFNIASLWNLPVLYVIENNKYAMGTSVSRSTASKKLYKSGENFGIKGVAVNGQDILSVENAVAKARKQIIKTSKPMIVEVRTYRYRGHSMSDPATYRSKEEVKNVRDHYDPIINFTNVLIRNKILTEEEIKKIESEAASIVKEAVAFATSSPEPDLKDLYSDVLVETN